MPRIKIHTHDAPPCLPQWRNKDGWIAENAGSGYYRVELEGGDRAVLHESEFYRADNPPEPTTQTVMVGHCPVEVPNSVLQRTMAQVNEQQAADWLTITRQVQDLPNV